MIPIPDKIIEVISENLECGKKCYLQIATGTVITAINDEYLIDADVEELDSSINNVKESPSDFIEFHAMDSRDSYNVMVDFAAEIKDHEFQAQLIKALTGTSPFRRFKSKLDYSDHYRQMWFDFKKIRYIDFVKAQIENELIE
jgi:hypothetical protein